MQIAENFTISPVDYANQGNSLIGIRGSGKTYTATKIAEELIKAGIPIIAFDPTGVWQYLRFRADGTAGLPVAVAGGLHGDIELTEENAVGIVEAALENKVSLIIDLQGTATANKSKWLRIVSDCVEFLMANNQQYGLRHVFIEEAAEFVPQKPSPGGALVYSRIESMARIGRNFGLGYTLINQRAEEIAKAVFEISELVIVHRQSGKNSLNSIKDWLQVRGQSDMEIVKTLPALGSGECWAIDNTREVKMKVLPKETFHPDPKNGAVLNHSLGVSGDVTVANFIASLNHPKSAKDQPKVKSKQVVLNDEIVETIKTLTDAVKVLASRVEKLEKVKQAPGAKEATIKEILVKSPERKTVTPQVSSSRSGAARMLVAAAMFSKGITKVRIGTIANLSPNSGSFGTYLSNLKKYGLVEVGNGLVTITAKGKEQAGAVRPYPKDPLMRVRFWCDQIGANSGAARILIFVTNQHPDELKKEVVGKNTGLSAASGSFGTYLSILKRNGLITVVKGSIKAADELFR